MILNRSEHISVHQILANIQAGVYAPLSPASAWIAPLIIQLPNIVEKLCSDAAAINLSRKPYVWLAKIAEFLNADFEIIYLSNRTSRSTIALTAKGRWSISIVAESRTEARISLAHELAHAILYKNAPIPTSIAWKGRIHSGLEEHICNYIARLLLTPPLVLEKLRSSNLITTIFNIHNECDMQQSPAIQRVFDYCCSSGSHPIVGIWWSTRQPASPKAVERFLKINAEGHLAQFLEQAGKTADGENLLSRLIHSIRTSQPDPKLTAKFENINISLIHERCRPLSAHQLELVFSGCAEVVRKSLPTIESLNWFRREKSHYISQEHASLRHDSIAAKAFLSPQKEKLDGVDAFSIGKIRGNYYTQVYAWGRHTLGKRNAVQIIWNDGHEPQAQSSLK